MACSKSATSLVAGNEPFSTASNFFSYLSKSNVPPEKKDNTTIKIHRSELQSYKHAVKTRPIWTRVLTFYFKIDSFLVFYPAIIEFRVWKNFYKYNILR